MARTFLILHFKVNREEQEIEIVKCPHCEGWFGVDATYLDQCDDVIHCPMCCMEVEISQGDDEKLITVIEAVASEWVIVDKTDWYKRLRLFWNNDLGWAEEPTIFTALEKEFLNLPINGEWKEYTKESTTIR